MKRAAEKIKEGAQPYLEPDEVVHAALVVAARGHTQQVAGVRELGSRQKGKQVAAGEDVGLQVTSPMALVLTQQRLMTLKIGAPIGMGLGGKVKEFLSAVPISDVDSIEAKRLAAGHKITVTVRGVPIALEAGAGSGAGDLPEALERAKAGLM